MKFLHKYSKFLIFSVSVDYQSQATNFIAIQQSIASWTVGESKLLVTAHTK